MNTDFRALAACVPVLLISIATSLGWAQTEVENGLIRTLYFDSSCSLFVSSMDEQHGASSLSKINNRFDDYQLFDGLTYPLITTQTTNGREVRFNLEAVEFNVQLDPEIFKRY